MIQDIFNQLSKSLKCIPAIKIVELDLKQYEKAGGITNAPAVYIKLGNPTYSQISKKDELVEVDLELKIYTEFKLTNSKATTSSNNHLQVENEIKCKLMSCELVSEVPMDKENGMLKSSLNYELKFTRERPKKPVSTIKKDNLEFKVSTTVQNSE